MESVFSSLNSSQNVPIEFAPRAVSDSPAKNATWIYDVAGDSWSPGPEMAMPRSKHVCKLVTDCDGDDKVMVVGGEGDTGGINSTEIYDVKSGSWSAGTI